MRDDLSSKRRLHFWKKNSIVLNSFIDLLYQLKIKISFFINLFINLLRYDNSFSQKIEDKERIKIL